jgi:hypothetical protein
MMFIRSSIKIHCFVQILLGADRQKDIVILHVPFIIKKENALKPNPN